VDRGVRVVSAPYRDSTPRPDAAPRVRRRWALRGDDLDRAMSGGLILMAMVVWSLFYIGCGFSREVIRGAEVVAGFALAWALMFVRLERVS